MTAPLAAADLAVQRGGEPVVEGFDLSVAAGELVALVGGSLTGKTLLLEALAGWSRPVAGTLRWLGAEVAPPWTGLAVVPQELALIEELTVAENVGLGLGGRRRGSGAGAAPAVREALDAVGIGHLAGRGGYEISIGERQRTMVARALAPAPAVLLADEPVAHQDAVRAEVVLRLLRARADAGGAVVLATRDPDFARLADRILDAPFGR